MDTPSTSRKRVADESPEGLAEGLYFPDSKMIPAEELLQVDDSEHSMNTTMDLTDDSDDEEGYRDVEYSTRSRTRNGEGPPLTVPAFDYEKNKKNFGFGFDTPYLTYQGQYWNPLWLYRLPSDITLQQIYHSGGEGVGRQDVGRTLGMDTDTKAGNRRVSAIIVNVCNDKKDYIGQYQKMEGKFRSIRYYWKADSQPDKFQKLFHDFETFSGRSCPFKLGQVIKFPNANLNTLRISDISLRRLNDLLELLSTQPVVVTINRVIKHIEERERAMGYNFSIDKKSLLKCIKALQNEKLLHLFETSVCCDEATNKILILCHRDITSVDDPIVNEYIQKTIDLYHKEGRVFPHGQLRISSKKKNTLETKEDAPDLYTELMLSSLDSSAPLSVDDRFNIFRAMTVRATVVKNETQPQRENSDKKDDTSNGFGENQDQELPKPPEISLANTIIDDDDIMALPNGTDKKRVVKMNTSMANLYGYQAKLLRMGILHEMAYHFVYGLPAGTKPTYYEKFPLGTLPAIRLFDPDPHVYVDEEGPLRFIPPLPPFSDAEQGWFMLSDLVCALPLSVLVLCAYVPKSIDNVVEEYLSHPIKRHTIIGDLPNELKLPILREKKLFRQLEHSFLSLSAMGLMCVGENPDPRRFVTPASMLFYVGKRGTLYDTSTSQRGYATISGDLSEYDNYMYEFECLEDVQLYWHHLRAVTLSTPLSFRGDMTENENISMHKHKKYSIGLIDKTLMTADYKLAMGNLEPLGPHDGCAGFDSALFLHLRRHWDINPRPSQFVTWFLKRFRNCAENGQKTIEGRVRKIQPDWNSFVNSMMPSDLDLLKTKKAIAKSETIYPSARASITIEPKSKTRLQRARKPRDWKKKKRPLDNVDILSQESRIHMRCRFNAKEKDMLILVRAVGFFLNPVYRFWLNPAVLRDIMHEYVPESRNKTVQSLMAAGVREMTRPNRLAYLQRIVRNLSTFPEMRKLRFRLASQPLTTTVSKTNFFRKAFDVANKLLFMDDQSMPPTSASDTVFEQFLKDENFILSPEQAQTNPMPLRSRPPIQLSHIHHSVAVNVLVSVLIHCDNGAMNERMLGQLNATIIQNALQVLRSDGLVTRTRTMDPNFLMIKSHHATLSFYFKHFFAHRFHPDIIDQTKLTLRLAPASDEEPRSLQYDGDHVGLILAASNSFYSDNDLDVFVEPDMLCVFEQGSVENAQNSTKQIRYLENKNLQLEKINVAHVVTPYAQNIPDVCQLVESLDKSQAKINSETASPNLFIKSFKNANKRNALQKIYDAIKKSGIFGIKLEELVQQTKVNVATLKGHIVSLKNEGFIVEVGVDEIRWISHEFHEAWCITINDRIFSPKPWSLPDGGICYSTVRWMAESCLFTVVANPGITLKDLHFRYEFVVQPSAITELAHLLEKAGCIIIKEEKFRSMELNSPFSNSSSLVSSVYCVPTVDCIERFARIFTDVSLLPSMVSTLKQEEEDSTLMETSAAEFPAGTETSINEYPAMEPSVNEYSTLMETSDINESSERELPSENVQSSFLDVER